MLFHLELEIYQSQRWIFITIIEIEIEIFWGKDKKNWDLSLLDKFFKIKQFILLLMLMGLMQV